MHPERWRLIDELFHEAVELDSGDLKEALAAQRTDVVLGKL